MEHNNSPHHMRDYARRHILLIVIVLIIVVLVSVWILRLSDYFSSSILVLENQERIDFSLAGADDPKSKSIAADEKKSAYEGLVRSYEIWTSGDAEKIRALLRTRSANSTENDHILKLSDEDLISYSQRLKGNISRPDPYMFIAPDTLYEKKGNTMIITFTNASGTVMTMKAVYIDGKWY